MSTIYKYSVYQVWFPTGAEIVHADLQNIWMRIDLNSLSTQEYRQFVIVGTGRNFSNNYKHVKTVIDGDFVWHIMEILNVQVVSISMVAFLEAGLL